MKKQRPGDLAVRAVNQYRQRDVFTYLSLRYYLENSAARSDKWASTVAVSLVCRRPAPSYFNSFHFKELEGAEPTHREMSFPGANEALAEAALIDACATLVDGSFRASEKVYSYRPAMPGDKSGIYEHYMHGLKRRHQDITVACRREPSAKVSFFDIKRFYPSIRADVAYDAWKTACESSLLPSHFKELGTKLIHDHALHSASSGGHILTGPMFSHLIANLVLKNVDAVMERSGVEYFRYVDDIALVGSSKQIKAASTALRVQLEALGLSLHEESSAKSMEVSASEWLEGVDDYNDVEGSDSWMRLIGDIKKLLVLKPSIAEDLALRFAANGLRIPILDYTAAAAEASYFEKVARYVRSPWFAAVSPARILDVLVIRATQLRDRYSQELSTFCEELNVARGFKAKRLIPKIRYRMGRLAYLSEPSDLYAMGDGVTDSSLDLQKEVVKAIATGQVERVLAMGGNVAQAVAQPVRMAKNRVEFSKEQLTPQEMQALAVFKLNGVDVSSPVVFDNELVRFAEHGADVGLMRSADPFISELASLHGVSSLPRHFHVLDTPFDPHEDIPLDAIDSLTRSGSI